MTALFRSIAKMARKRQKLQEISIYQQRPWLNFEKKTE